VFKTVKKIVSSIFYQNSHLSLSLNQNQGIIKGEVSLYHWSPVWLVWNQLYHNRQFLFLFAKQANPNRSDRRWMVQWYFPFSILWPEPPLWEKLIIKKNSYIFGHAVTTIDISSFCHIRCFSDPNVCALIISLRCWSLTFKLSFC
jgi:hypothetical protein